MAKFFSLIVLLLSINTAFAGIIVVTDLDETIKMYGSSKTWSKVKKALYSNKVYRGMPLLLQTLDRTTDRQYVLTGSPSIIRRSMWRLLNYHKIPVDGLISNRWAPIRKTYPYKYRKLTGLFNYFKDDQFILIGDNTGGDSRAYKEMAEKYPGRVLAIYIHSADIKEPIEGVTNFYSAYEVAYQEYQAGRMSYADVEQIYINIFEAGKLNELFAIGGDCPTDKNLFSHMDDAGLIHLTRLMSDKIVEYCSSL